MPSYTFTENTSSQNTADSPTNGTVEDARLLEINPTQNNGSDSNLAIAKFSSGDHQTSLFRIDTSSIPDTETITSVTAYFYQNFFGGPGTQRDFAFHDQIETSWTEGGCNWNTRDGTNTWGSGGSQGLGSDIENTPFLQDSIGNGSQYHSFSLSPSIVSLTGNTEFLVRLDEVGDSGEISVITSSEGSDGQRPEFHIITTAGSGNNIEVPAGTLSSLGFEPSFVAGSGNFIDIPTGAVDLSGSVPTVLNPVSINVPPQSLSAGGLEPSFSAPVSIEVPLGSINLAFFEPSFSTSFSSNIPTGAISLTGIEPTFVLSGSVDIPQGSVSLLGYEPTFSGSTAVDVPSAVFTINSFEPAVNFGLEQAVTIPARAVTFVGLTPIVFGDIESLPDNYVFTLPARDNNFALPSADNTFTL